MLLLTLGVACGSRSGLDLGLGPAEVEAGSSYAAPVDASPESDARQVTPPIDASARDSGCKASDARNACEAVAGNTFVSVTPHSLGRGGGVGAWTISFTSTTFRWSYGDVTESGTYSCQGWHIVGTPFAGGTVEADFDPACGILTWDGQPYEGVPQDAGRDAARAEDAACVAARPGLQVTFQDNSGVCDCATRLCCTTTTLDFGASACSNAFYLFCGDLAACDPPPVGWERLDDGGTWQRIVTPAESSNSAWLCTPASWANPTAYSVPLPPSGTVRAVALFDSDCSGDGGACRMHCGHPYAVFSNPIQVP